MDIWEISCLHCDAETRIQSEREPEFCPMCGYETNALLVDSEDEV
jgi:rRNA maturation endonuclease Nob1